MATKSKIWFIGGTGYIGKFIVEASAKAGHPTSVLVRDSTLSNPGKSNVIDNFKNLGGDLFDHESLVKAIKQVDVVISTVGHAQLVEQGRIIAAIKEAGNVKVTFLKIGVIFGVLAPINALFRIETPFDMPLSTSAKVGKPESLPKSPCSGREPEGDG
ncbi:hypothetical protein D5086_008996 [Populus alba]|uniref:Uncharacterized protein n=1 Tax=Populus alba TaxID=43335 RepID=A0ACC4CH03_POPAL